MKKNIFRRKSKSFVTAIEEKMVMRLGERAKTLSINNRDISINLEDNAIEQSIITDDDMTREGDEMIVLPDINTTQVEDSLLDFNILCQEGEKKY
uniref:Uncharacterized protein n=1 Tax=Parastrongyloides trichosuri TaxID=131310 RepID=A0A0N4ZMZ4_PARTI